MNQINMMKMLQVDLDSESDEQPHSKPLKSKVFCLRDKFKTATISKGMFQYEEQQQTDYISAPFSPTYKLTLDQQQAEQPYSNPKIVRQEDANEALQSQDVTKIQIKQEMKQNTDLRITSLLLTSKMMQMHFSSDDQKQPQEEKEIELSPQEHSQPLIQHKQQKQIQLIDTKQLLEGTSDICQFSRIFCLKPIQQHQYLNLSIHRNSSGLNSFWPQFRILIGKFQQQFLFAKKMMGSTTSNYYITSQQGVEKVNHINFIGKMRSNFSGSLYNIFDNGMSPQKATYSVKKRSIQATIRFKSQILTMQPRQFQLFMLKPGTAYETLAGTIQNKQIGLDILFQQQANRSKIIYLKNRKPGYSETLNGYVLNFSGRIKVPSVKNFILQDVTTKKQVLMLGKTSENIFRVDVSAPISPYIAICVCLANIDSKFISD